MERALNELREQLREKKLNDYDVEIQQDPIMGAKINLFVIYRNNIKAPLFGSTNAEKVSEYIATRL